MTPIFHKPEMPLIQRLRNLESIIPEKIKYYDVLDTVVCSLDFVEAIANLAKEAADALEGTIEIPIYDQEEIHHGCTVQVLYSSYTGDYSVGWWKEGEV